MEGHVTLAQRHFPSWGHSDSGRTLCSVLEESHALGRTGKKREGPVAPVSWAAASQLKIRGIEYSSLEQNSSLKSYPDYEFSFLDMSTGEKMAFG